MEGKVTIIASHIFLFSCGVAHSHANAVSFHLQDETVKLFLQAVAFVCLTIVFFFIYIFQIKEYKNSLDEKQLSFKKTMTK